MWKSFIQIVIILGLSVFVNCSSDDERARKEFDLGLRLVSREQYDKAIDAFQEAIRITPNFFDAHYELGRTQMYKLEWEQAVISLRRATELNTEHARAFMTLGWVYGNWGRYFKSNKAILEAIRLDSAWLEKSYSDLGKNCFYLGEYDQAINYLRKVLAPSHSRIVYDYYHMGLSHYYLDQWDSAVVWLNKATAVEIKERTLSQESQSRGLCRLGYAYYEMKEYDKAIAALEDCIELDPINSLAFRVLGSSPLCQYK